MASVNQINPFSNMSAIQGAGAVSSSSGGASAAGGGGAQSGSSSNNPFSGSTAGVNTNIGVGDSMNIAAQAGKKSGVGTTLGFA